jgi:DNA-binding GntR family transcriptional regulator
MSMPETGDGPAQLKLREQAYDRFTRQLLTRELRPGQFVSQRELVALTGMKLGAIRELIPRLEAEGLIRTVPQRGMQIAHLDLHLIRDAYQFRLFLEGPATRLFVETTSDEVLQALHARHLLVVERARAEGHSRNWRRSPRRPTGACTTRSSMRSATRSSARPTGSTRSRSA